MITLAPDHQLVLVVDTTSPHSATATGGRVTTTSTIEPFTTIHESAVDGAFSLAVCDVGESVHVKFISLTNISALTLEGRFEIQNPTLGQISEIIRIQLEFGESISYSSESGFQQFDRTGQPFTTVKTPLFAAVGQQITAFKAGTAPEAAGVWYSCAKDVGFPGAFVPGTPGLAGRAIAVAEAGCIRLPTSGAAIMLNDLYAQNSTSCLVALRDYLWINSGIAVTTLTAQTINSVALPARDVNGSTNGLGVQAGLLFTAASTNAAPISNCTISYTNSNGVAGRTGTMSLGYTIPTTPVVGTFVSFALQSGDTGVRSIQTITLGTSLGAGAVSLVLFTDIAAVAATGNTISTAPRSRADGKCHQDAALLVHILPSGTGAPALSLGFQAIPS